MTNELNLVLTMRCLGLNLVGAASLLHVVPDNVSTLKCYLLSNYQKYNLRTTRNKYNKYENRHNVKN